jgi:hypothetical protein
MKKIISLWAALALSACMSVSSADSGIVSKNFVPSGANVVTRSMQDKMRETVSLDDYTSLAAAIAALPAAGGVINVPVGRYRAGVWKYDTNYMSKANVTLRGAKMPSCSANCDRLTGGSVIEGRFNVFADNFTIENIGIDAGKYVVDQYYGGADTHAANHPNGDTWDAFAFAQPSQGTPLAARRNFTARNVIGLTRDSASVGHAMLMEGIDGGIIENVVGMYGIHATVIKAQNVAASFVAGYGASGDHVIIKSDTYAHAGNIKIDTVETGFAPPGVVAWSTPAVAMYGLLLNPATDHLDTVKIGSARLSGALQMLAANSTQVKNLDNLMIGNLEIEGTGTGNSIGINFAQSVAYSRVRLGRVTISNTKDGVAYYQAYQVVPPDALEIESLTMENMALRGIQALGYGRLKIGRLRATAINVLYAIDDTARVLVGKADENVITTQFANGPSLVAGWQQFPGASKFRIQLDNYGVRITGLLQPVTGATGDIINLPPYLRTVDATRRLTYGSNASGVTTPIMVNIDGGYAKLAINNGVSKAGAETFLSLDGISYPID